MNSFRRKRRSVYEDGGSALTFDPLAVDPFEESVAHLGLPAKRFTPPKPPRVKTPRKPK